MATAVGGNNRESRPFWRDSIEVYERPAVSRSLLDLATSVLPYVLLSVAGYLTFSVSVWITLGLSVLASGFLLRTFIVFHDCAHGSFFRSRSANLWVGRLCALLTFQAFADWRHSHAVHHGSAGDLDRRGTGDVPTLTVDEYMARSWRGRLAYRLFRNPLVMFGIGPIWSLMVTPRIWSKNQRPRQRHSVWLTNLALAATLAPIWWFEGFGAWVVVQMPAAVIAGTAGVFLFYVQHQFEDAYWVPHSHWDYVEAALRGSSHLQLPQPLRWLTANIGLHHVHHVAPRIPNYRLQQCHDASAVFQRSPTITLRSATAALRLSLWDEDQRRLVRFRDVTLT